VTMKCLLKYIELNHEIIIDAQWQEGEIQLDTLGCIESVSIRAKYIELKFNSKKDPQNTYPIRYVAKIPINGLDTLYGT